MTMRAVLSALLFVLLPAPQQAPAPLPVVVELFTSEGCSSCPAADALLSTLTREQPVAGASILALEWHVDYWDQLGWKDPVALRAATTRQEHYTARFGPDHFFTPQAVIDGREDAVGSDEGGVRQAISRALSHPRASVSLRARADGDGLFVDAAVANLPAQAVKENVEAALVILENGITSVVKRGENGGRTLHHDNVVRAIEPVGRLQGDGDLHHRVALRPDWTRERIKAVLILQGSRTRTIWGAAAVTVQ